MEFPRSHQVTGLLQAWGAGNEEALQKLTLWFTGLHRAARRYVAEERAGHTLQATALINEVYLRLVDVRRMDWQNRAHFFAVCGQSRVVELRFFGGLEVKQTARVLKVSSRDGNPGLETSEGLALVGTQWGESPWNLNAGTELKTCITPR